LHRLSSQEALPRLRIDARLACEQLEDRQLLSDGLDLTGVEFRTRDGTSNNLDHLTQGAARTPQIRFGYGAQFPDGFGDATRSTIYTSLTVPRTGRRPRVGLSVA